MFCSNYYVNKVISFLKKQIVFDFIFTSLLLCLIYKIVSPVIALDSYKFPLPITDTKIVTVNLNSKILLALKKVYYVISFIACLSFVNAIYERFFKDIFSLEPKTYWYDVKIPKYPYDKSKFRYIVGLVHNETDIELSKKPYYEVIEEDGLFQNVLCTGTIGQGKTISFLTQFLLQMIYYQYDNPDKKVAMLCLDVKGNFYQFVQGFAYEVGRLNDLIIIEVGGKWKYNPLHKPNLSAIELANRMRYILELFVGSDPANSYWIGKAEDTIVELIKLIRLYNDNYVNFEELHKLGTNPEFREKIIKQLQAAADNGELNEEQLYDFKTAKAYFDNEYSILPDKAQAFILSEITQMTQPFISTKAVKDTFCPSRSEINFYGFEDVIKEGKIVVWKINANKEPKVAKLIAAYLKLDYQKEIMITLEKKKTDPISANRYKVTICDEYQAYVTKNDAEFLSQSREPRSVTAACTQSYTSLRETLRNEDTTNMLLQSFVNKVWMRTDDEYTTKRIMNHIGKEEKKKVSTSITETGNKSRVSFSIGKVINRGKNLSSSSSYTTQKDYRFDEHFLMQELDAYKAICFISTGKKIKTIKVVHMTPLFEGRIMCVDNTLKYVTDEKLIFKYIGDIDIYKLDNDTIKDISDEEKLNFSNDIETPINHPTEKKLKFIVDKPSYKVLDMENEAHEQGVNKQIEKQDKEKRDINPFDDIF